MRFLTSKEAVVEICKKEFEDISGGDTSITKLVEYLQERSEINHRGKMGTTAPVNKEALRLASVYLEDYMNLLEVLHDMQEN